MQPLKFSSKGFAFTLEVIIALIIFVSFLQFAFYSPASSENPLHKTEIKELSSSVISFLDNNGFILSSLDSALLENEKMESIYLMLSNYIPANYDFRIKLTAFDSNKDTCVPTEQFDDCFDGMNPFPEKGNSLPTEKSVSHEKYYFVSKGIAQECSFSAAFSSIKETPYNKVFFSEQKPKLFFADSPDLNIFFNVGVSPPGEASCGDTIRVDLNAYISVPGRPAANLMLVQDKSGSMSWDGYLDLSNSSDVYVDGSYAYIADGSSGLRDINVLSQNSPSIVGTYNSPGTASGVAVVGNYAYLADGTSGLNIVNISNKSSPSSSGSLSGIGTAQKVASTGDYAYVVTSTDGSGKQMYLDISGTDNTQTYIGRTSYTWAAQSFVATQDLISQIDLYLKRTGSAPQRDLDVIVRSSLQGADIASATISVSSVGTSYAWETANFSSPFSLTVGQTYYILLETSRTNSSRYYYWGGRNSNPYAGGNAYQETTSLPTTDTFMRLYSSISRGLQIIDTTSKSSPQYIKSIAGSDPNDVFVSGNYAYLADGTYGLKIIDISNPLSALTVGSIDTTDATGIYVSGNYVYLADGSSGLRIINATTKTNPSIAATYNTPEIAYDVFVYDNNAYVADNSSLQIINISNPSSPVYVNAYTTPYNYQRVFISNDWAFLTPGYSTGLITFNIFSGPKMDQSQRAGDDFIDQAEWKTGDGLGLVSFASSDTTDQTLLRVDDTNRLILKNTLNNLIANGGTAMGDAIYAATAELNSSRSSPGSYKFQILLSDGQSNSGSSPITAAQNAAANNIKIYTIGFGGDADSATLTQIAQLTDANYYFAADENSLQTIYDLIAIDVGDYLSGIGAIRAFDSNLLIPVDSCDFFTDTGNGECTFTGDQNYLFYNIGYLDKDNNWQDYFELNIPCDSEYACSTPIKIFPSPGTLFHWRDINGLVRTPIAWDVNQQINFKYRDLTISILNAIILGENQVFVDINAANIGLLSSGATTIDFYLNDPVTGILIKQKNVSMLSPSQFQLFLDEALGNEGQIYAIINKNQLIEECPGNNTVSILCTNAPKTRYYALDLWMWKK